MSTSTSEPHGHASRVTPNTCFSISSRWGCVGVCHPPLICLTQINSLSLSYPWCASLHISRISLFAIPPPRPPKASVTVPHLSCLVQPLFSHPWHLATPLSRIKHDWLTDCTWWWKREAYVGLVPGLDTNTQTRHQREHSDTFTHQTNHTHTHSDTQNKQRASHTQHTLETKNRQCRVDFERISQRLCSHVSHLISWTHQTQQHN